MPKPFNLSKLDKRMRIVSRSKDSIQSLSIWILNHKQNSNDISKLWLKTLEKSDPAQCVTLFYVANDVLQQCKRRNAPEFRVSFAEVLKDAMGMARRNNVQVEVTRILKIWEERHVYSPELLAELTEALTSDEKLLVETKSHSEDDQMGDQTLDSTQQETDEAEIIANFKAKDLVNHLKQLAGASKEVADKQQKLGSRLDLAIPRITSLERKPLADKQKIAKKFDTTRKLIEDYLKAATEELSIRKNSVRLLQNSQVFFTKQNGEVKHVSHLFKVFGKKVKLLQQKLNEKILSFPEIVPESPTLDESVITTPPRQTDFLEAPESSLDSKLSELIGTKSIPIVALEKQIKNFMSPSVETSSVTHDNEEKLDEDTAMEDVQEKSPEVVTLEDSDSPETSPEKKDSQSKSGDDQSPSNDNEPNVGQLNEVSQDSTKPLLNETEAELVCETETENNNVDLESDSINPDDMSFPDKTDSPACSVTETTSSLMFSLLRSTRMLRQVMPIADSSNTVQQLDETNHFPFETLFKIVMHPSKISPAEEESAVLISKDSSVVSKACEPDAGIHNEGPIDMDLDSD